MKYLLVLILLFCVGCSGVRSGASVGINDTFILPNTPTVTYDAATYILLFDLNSGAFVHADTGVVSGSNVWSVADIATVAHPANAAVYTTTLPALDLGYEYVMTVWSGTNYSTADTFQAGPWLYDPKTGKVYTDTNPIKNSRVRSIKQ